MESPCLLDNVWSYHRAKTKLQSIVPNKTVFCLFLLFLLLLLLFLGRVGFTNDVPNAGLRRPAQYMQGNTMNSKKLSLAVFNSQVLPCKACNSTRLKMQRIARSRSSSAWGWSSTETQTILMTGSSHF